MESKASTIEVRHLGGTGFSIEVRGHDLFVDQPLEGGGEDFGPMPTELLVASLAVSVAFYGRGSCTAAISATPSTCPPTGGWSWNRHELRA